jgi:hypothetical protein
MSAMPFWFLLVMLWFIDSLIALVSQKHLRLIQNVFQ